MNRLIVMPVTEEDRDAAEFVQHVLNQSDYLEKIEPLIKAWKMTQNLLAKVPVANVRH